MWPVVSAHMHRLHKLRMQLKFFHQVVESRPFPGAGLGQVSKASLVGAAERLPSSLSEGGCTDWARREGFGEPP